MHTIEINFHNTSISPSDTVKYLEHNFKRWNHHI